MWTILTQFDGCCAYCGSDRRPGAMRMAQEHMTPLARGGSHTASNVVPACKHCNSAKHTKTWEEFKPGIPRPIVFVVSAE